MKLQDLPRLLPGADVRIRLRSNLVFVSLKHDGLEGHAAHPEVTFALRRAVGELRETPVAPGGAP